MEFNLSNQAKHPNLLNLFPEYPCLEHDIRTPQSSVLVPPPHNNPLLNYHLNTNFHDHILSVPNNPNIVNRRLSPNIHVIHLCGMPSSTSTVISQSFETKCFNQDGFLNTPCVPDVNTTYKIRRQWTANEDMELVKLLKQHGLKKWPQIARLMKGGRDGKQCRERWINHLRPNIKKCSWTLEEDMILIKSHWKVGNKWSEISRLLDRCENSVKNHWNSTKRRQSMLRKRNPNITNKNDGSLLYEYINMVTSAEKVAKELKKNIIEMKMKMLGAGSENLARLLNAE